MRNNVHFIYRFPGVEFVIPPGSLPSDKFQPVRVYDNSLQKIGVFAGDLLAANLALEPDDGRFSYVKTPQEFLLGYPFKKPNGRVKVERVCHAPCCPPLYLQPSDLLAVAPVVRLYRHRHGISYNYCLNERREELWRGA